MNRASPRLRSIASQLVAFEAQADRPPGVPHPAAFQSIGKLRPHLSMLMGRDGFQALLARSMTLACRKASWLTAVQVDAGGELQGLAIAQAKVEAATFSEGEVMLLTELLGLLVAFVGPTLTLRLVVQVWPEFAVDDAFLGNSENDGKAN